MTGWFWSQDLPHHLVWKRPKNLSDSWNSDFFGASSVVGMHGYQKPFISWKKWGYPQEIRPYFRAGVALGGYPEIPMKIYIGIKGWADLSTTCIQGDGVHGSWLVDSRGRNLVNGMNIWSTLYSKLTWLTGKPPILNRIYSISSKGCFSVVMLVFVGVLSGGCKSCCCFYVWWNYPVMGVKKTPATGRTTFVVAICTYV